MTTAVEAETQPPLEPELPAPPAGSFAQIIKNVLVNWTALAVTLGSGFWMFPFLIRHLGKAEYGVWILTGSLVGSLGLLDFGITQSTVKFTAEHRARGDQGAINRVITGALSVFSVVALFSLAASAVLALNFNHFFGAQLPALQLPDRTVAVVVMLVGLNVAITFPASVFLGVLRGYQRYDIGAAAMSVSILARCVVIYFAITGGQGIIALAAITLVFDVLRLGYVVFRVLRLNPDIRIGRAHFERTELGKLFGTSAWLFLIMVGDQINFATDNIVIGHFLPLAALVIYSIPLRLIGYLRQLVMEMVGVLMPAVSGLHASDDAAGVEELLIAGAKWTALLSLPPAGVFWVLGERFIQLWIGPEYAPQAAQLLLVLTLGILAHLTEMTVTTVLVGTGRAQAVAKWVIAQSLVNLVLSLILVRQYGLMGIALGTTVSMIAFALLSIPTYFRAHLRVPLGHFVRQALLPPLWAQIPWLLALWALREWAPMGSLPAFFGMVLLATPLYGAAVFAGCLNPTERAAIVRRFKPKKVAASA